MTEEKKPIKRSEQLAPLSRDHHEGLLLVWKIRQGIKLKIEKESISKYCSWFWQHHLQEHFRKEEQFLLQIIPSSHELMQQMFSEHELIKEQLHELDQKSAYEKLEQFAQTLNDHIRFEERKLFSEIENTATPEQLDQIAKELNDEKVTAVWNDEFWVKK